MVTRKSPNFTKLTDRPKVIVLRNHYIPNRSKDKYRLVNAARQIAQRFRRFAAHPNPAASTTHRLVAQPRSSPAKKKASSPRAVSGPSLPWTAFFSMSVPYLCRMVPAGAFFESVGPIASR